LDLFSKQYYLQNSIDKLRIGRLENAQNMMGLEDSLLDLHSSVRKLIQVIQNNAVIMDRKEEILNKLPLLDFYNDALLRNINSLKSR
jgi:hypothetical protein